MAKSKEGLPFDKKGGRIVVQLRLLKSVAYINLSPQAKVLMLLLHVHWRNERPVGFGLREAQELIPCSRKLASRAFKELQSAGFIEMVDESVFCRRSQSKARTWRLTWLPFKSSAPTNDWEKTDAK